MFTAFLPFIQALVMCFMYLIKHFFEKRFERRRMFRNSGIPGPKSSILLGNFDELEASLVPHEVLSSWIRKYGDVLVYYIGEVPHLVVKNQEMLKKIFVTDFNAFFDRPFPIDLSPYDKSLLGLKGKRWMEVRRIISHSFSTVKIKMMAAIITRKVDVTVDIISKRARSNEIFDIYELIQGLSVDVLADCSLAMETHCQEDPNDVFFNNVRNMFKNVKNEALKWAIMFPLIGRLMTPLYKLSAAGKMTSQITNRLKKAIAERRENPEIRRVDFLQLMMDNRGDEGLAGRITDEEILANCFIFLVAGFETSANAIAFTIYLLIKHPNIQERLYQEISKTESDSYEAIQSLQYLDQVVKESLRIYPPATLFTSRQCKEDYQLGSKTIPKGTAVVAPVWDIHHDPDLWPNPRKFDPERFSPENKSSYNNLTYMPFGLGKRNCVGSKFATLEIKDVLFRLIKKFQFLSCEKTEKHLTLFCATAVIGPANGVYLKAVSRYVDQ